MTTEMTVKELMAILAKYDDDDIVELSSPDATLEVHKKDFSKFETILEIEEMWMG